MQSLKHIGKIKNTGTKVIVVFRTLPGESNMSLVLPTTTLPDQYHNAIMDLVETAPAQDSFEFGEQMFIKYFPDGRPMLQAMQADNRMQKVPTDSVIMTPTNQHNMPLDQLNILIAEQKNCTVDELCTFVKGSTPSTKLKEQPKAADAPVAKVEPLKAPENTLLTDKDIAKSYRSQADAMYKEAARLRKDADDLDPPAKKATKAKEEASA